MVTTQSVQSSVPDWMMTYLHQLADVKYGRKLNRMYIEMVDGFLLTRPYRREENPLSWYMPRVHAYRTGVVRGNADANWVALNMILPVELLDKVRTEIEMINMNNLDETKVSMRIYIYTAAVWWVSQIHPYKGLKLIH